MPRVRLFHWKTEGAAPLIAQLEAAGFWVDYEEKISSFRRIRESPTDIFAIDLSLRPSHGRELAIALRGHKATHHIPIVFVGGEAAKVKDVRRVLPDAAYSSSARLVSALRRAKPLARPHVPPQMMERYAGRPAAQKLGIAKDARVAVVDPPADYVRAIGKLPDGASFAEQDWSECTLTLWFMHDFPSLQAALPELRKTAARGRLWILWRKGQKGSRKELDGGIVRSAASEAGLVDYKICSVNDAWSGMAFAIRKPH
jgi:hypothetical protein